MTSIELSVRVPPNPVHDPVFRLMLTAPLALVMSLRSSVSVPDPPATLSMLWPLETMIVSAPAPPLMSSTPVPPLMVSFPVPPSMVSLPASPLRVSLPPLPSIVSLSLPPLMVSLNARPIIVSAVPLSPLIVVAPTPPWIRSPSTKLSGGASKSEVLIVVPRGSQIDVKTLPEAIHVNRTRPSAVMPISGCVAALGKGITAPPSDEPSELNRRATRRFDALSSS